MSARHRVSEISICEAQRISVFGVAYPVCRLGKRLHEAIPEVFVQPHIRYGAGHARHPLVTLIRGDGEGKMPRPQTRMAELLLIKRWAAKPAHEEFE